MRRPTLAVLIVLVWVLLWDRFTVNHLLGGIVVAAALLTVLHPPQGADHAAIPTRPAALVRLALWFARQIIVSNLQVSRAALFPRRYVRPGVVRVPLRSHSPRLAALVSNLTALSPGMQPIGSTDDPPSIDVHVLSLESDAHARAIVSHLEDLLLAAFGNDPEEPTS